MSSSERAASAFGEAAVALICELEDRALTAGMPLALTVTDHGKLSIRPSSILTPDLQERIRAERESLVVLARVCDDGVTLRRAHFSVQLRKHPSRTSFRLRTDLDAEPGQCVSCGDNMLAPVVCWRCQLATRLVLCGDVPADWTPAEVPVSHTVAA